MDWGIACFERFVFGFPIKVQGNSAAKAEYIRPAALP
jgi:hypothetical protein